MTRWKRRKITKHIKNTHTFTIGQTKYTPVQDYCIDPLLIFYYKAGSTCEDYYFKMEIRIYSDGNKWAYCPIWFCRRDKKSYGSGLISDCYTDLCRYPDIDTAIHEGLQYANRAMALNGFPSDANKALKKAYREWLPTTPRWKEVILRIWKRLF